MASWQGAGGRGSAAAPTLPSEPPPAHSPHQPLRCPMAGFGIPVCHSRESAGAGDKQQDGGFLPKEGDGGLDQGSLLQPARTPASSVTAGSLGSLEGPAFPTLGDLPALEELPDLNHQVGGRKPLFPRSAQNRVEPGCGRAKGLVAEKSRGRGHGQGWTELGGITGSSDSRWTPSGRGKHHP